MAAQFTRHTREGPLPQPVAAAAERLRPSGRAVLLRGGRVIDPSQNLDAVADLLLQDSLVTWCSASGRPLPMDASACDVVDARGLVVAPGFVDLHCHLREPGFESKETIASGTRSAAAGGFTTICCMPNTHPIMDNRSVVDLVLRIAAEQGVVRVLPIGAISKGSQGKELARLGEMAESGAVGFSDDGQPSYDAALTQHAMEYSLALGLPIIDHCQDPILTRGASMHDGPVAARLGLKGWPAAAEDSMVARNIELCRLTGARVHMAHVSTAGAVDLVRRAKAAGLPVTAEVTPHHLTLTDERILGAGYGMLELELATNHAPAFPYDTAAKVNPPLRSAADVRALREGLADGTIDCIATDHAPHAPEDKLVEFDAAANGISGFETALPACLSLVHHGFLTLPALISKMSTEPARMLADGKTGTAEARHSLVPAGLGTLAPGAPADVVLIDPNAEWVVDPQVFISKGKNSPYNGIRMKGRVVRTFAAGAQVYQLEL